MAPPSLGSAAESDEVLLDEAGRFLGGAFLSDFSGALAASGVRPEFDLAVSAASGVAGFAPSGGAGSNAFDVPGSGGVRRASAVCADLAGLAGAFAAFCAAREADKVATAGAGLE